jgi:hypothetical protein
MIDVYALLEKGVPIRLRSPRAPWIGLLALSVLLLAVGIGVLPQEPLYGIAMIALFGAGIAIGIAQLMPANGWLLLDKDGFEFSALFRKTRVRWTEVDRIVPAFVMNKPAVGWTYKPEHRPALPPGRTTLVGADRVFPGTYGLKQAEFAVMLQALHAMHGGSDYS